MPHHDGLLDAQAPDRRAQQCGLGLERPAPTAGAGAVAEAGAVERDHAVRPGQVLDQATGLEVGGRDRVAMDQHDRKTFAPLDAVQPHTIDVDERPARRMLAFGTPCLGAHPNRRACSGAEGQGRRQASSR